MYDPVSCDVCFSSRSRIYNIVSSFSDNTENFLAASEENERRADTLRHTTETGTAPPFVVPAGRKPHFSVDLNISTQTRKLRSEHVQRQSLTMPFA
jgi:hypothetical protein